MNRNRRDSLRDAAIEVLAEAGGRGLTHRAVDATAEVPAGTTKNYFPTRDALLAAVADRCVELYRDVPRPAPADRAGLAAMLRALLENVAGPGRARMLAYLELRAEATRRPHLAALLDTVAIADFTAFEDAQSAAGLPVTPPRAAAVTLALHAAVPHLLTGGQGVLAAAGLDDLDRFAHGLLDTVYGPAHDSAAQSRRH
ncbi:TetR family transcriptional regulator [Kitasatospora sp. NBC_00240]|uniref:TetR/AcrR family transcriptional regulator n=1 Tax=Kitasatospora sp. NBC_00240 TaxID=2903567 RepID=UPI00225381F5|nr:TetR family transcriptional regulator [Kitasatospora sp. NBC_00240]MCX5208393.1 TetR family transcriptional regulator [Kitasatospora sp. NBC_00240]